MTWRDIERKIWRMWKDNYTLPRTMREVSRITRWSEYLSLCFIVDYLHNEKGIDFSRRQLRYAFHKLPNDEIDEGDEQGALRWVLSLGGYEYRRGKKSSQGDVKNTPILSSSRVKIASMSVSQSLSSNFLRIISPFSFFKNKR